MDCAPENTREPRTGASARAFRVAVLDESYASAESFTLRGKVLPEVVEKNCTEPCLVTRPPGLFSFLHETPHPCHSDAKPVLIPGQNSPPLSFRSSGLFSFLGRNSPRLSFRRPGLFSSLAETLHPCHSDAQASSHSWAKLSPLVIPTPKGGGICGTTHCCRIDFAMVSVQRHASPPTSRRA